METATFVLALLAFFLSFLSFLISTDIFKKTCKIEGSIESIERRVIARVYNDYSNFDPENN